MSYTALNIAVYSAAFAGAMAGMGASNKVPTDPNPASYDGLASTAGAFAQAFDAAWGANTATVIEIDTIKEITEACWESRAPQNVPPFNTAGNYAVLANAIKAIVKSGTNYNESQGVVPTPTPIGPCNPAPAGANAVASPYFIDVNRKPNERAVKLSVWDVGPGTAGTIVFVPGWASDWRDWQWQLNYFSSVGYRCILVVSRGLGQSDQPDGPYTLDVLTDDLRQVLDTLDPTNTLDAVLVGHSLGSNVALHYAVRHCNAHIRKLALVGVSPLSGTVFPPVDFATLIGGMSFDLPATLTSLADVLFYAGGLIPPNPFPYPYTMPATNGSAAQKASAIDMALQSAPNTLIKLLGISQFSPPQLGADAPLVTIPTLVMGGTWDLVTPFPNAIAMAAAIPGATLVEFKYSGHLPHYSEQIDWNAIGVVPPDVYPWTAFNTTLQAFLA